MLFIEMVFDYLRSENENNFKSRLNYYIAHIGNVEILCLGHPQGHETLDEGDQGQVTLCPHFPWHFDIWNGCGQECTYKYL